ncbi:MAG: hypothetical protein WD772_08085 [Pseudohongiellaceae bacterium]
MPARSMEIWRSHLLRWVILLLASSFSITLMAQLSYQKGQYIEPAYEGWRENEDGSFSFIFGYFNENWEQELDIQVGDSNFFSPGDRDRGQPTHFLPRRNRFTFEVRVPSDWGSRELVWTVISPNGETRRAYATLATDYTIDNIVIASETGSLGAGTSSPESRSNTPPQVTVQGDSVRTVRTGEPLRIVARIMDDGLPKPRGLREGEEEIVDAATLTRRMLNPPRRSTVGKTNGLFLSWNIYRGPELLGVQDKVRFNPPLSKPWEDTRTSANSPWGPLWMPPPIPENGLYEVEVTFDEPGTYVLWARADDGGLFHDQYITVNVSP